MFEKPSLITRIAIGKGVGLVFGVIALLLWPVFVADIGWMPRIGILFWYPTVGAVIGVFGVFSRHPVLHLPMPWWFRSGVIGAWMGFVLIFFAYDICADLMVGIFGVNGALQSPFWLIIGEAVIGMIIGFVATRLGGEGAETVRS